MAPAAGSSQMSPCAVDSTFGMDSTCGPAATSRRHFYDYPYQYVGAAGNGSACGAVEVEGVPPISAAHPHTYVVCGAAGEDTTGIPVNAASKSSCTLGFQSSISPFPVGEGLSPVKIYSQGVSDVQAMRSTSSKMQYFSNAVLGACTVGSPISPLVTGGEFSPKNHSAGQGSLELPGLAYISQYLPSPTMWEATPLFCYDPMWQGPVSADELRPSAADWLLQEHEDVLVLNSFPSNCGNMDTCSIFHSKDLDYQFPRSNLYKTELCRSWEETGYCRYSTKCQFAHGSEDLRPVPRHPKYKTEICRSYTETGLCPYGKRCRFIHKSDILSKVSGPVFPPSPDRFPEDWPSAEEDVHNSRRLPIFRKICSAGGS